jgi:two-component system aerobic respiration control sensor histidine kinase ArcB
MKKTELKYLKQVLMLLPGNVYWKDREGRYLGCNYQQLQVARVKSLDEIIGKTDRELYSSEIANRIMKTDKEIIEKRLDRTLEEVGVNSEGEKTVYLTKKSPLYDEFGQVVGLLGIGVNISEKKKAEQAIIQAKEAAEAASQAKTEFLKNMRHDIRTPLTGIVGCAQLIQAHANNAEKVAEYADDLIQSSDALLKFLNNVLESISVATGEIPLLKKKFNFRHVLEAAVQLNRARAAEKNLALTLSYDQTIPVYLIGDPIRAQRIVLELIANALKFTEKGQIKVTASLEKSEARQIIIKLRVSDTGIGIPIDKQQDIYTRFKRLVPSYKGIYSGTGLGLSIVKQFIDDLQAEIYLDSQPNQGATFTCLIPFQESLVTGSVGVEDIPVPMANKVYKKTRGVSTDLSFKEKSCAADKRILLVEDDRLAAKVAESMMSTLNCRIDVASNAKAALERLKEQTYLFILMDIGLPDMDGISLTRRIRLEQWHHGCVAIPIIGLTAHIEQENKQRCLDAGMNMVILKPLRKETVIALLAAFVQNEPADQALLSNTPATKDAVLDFDELKALLKDDELIEECRELMISGLSEDLVKLANWYQTSDWESIQAIAHKWQGGASYCGAKRLEQACKKFSECWAMDEREQLRTLYQQLVQEMESVKEVCVNYDRRDWKN